MCHMSQCWDCPKRWVGTICMSLPVADLGPPQTGHGLFQVLPQVSNVLHCPHASRLGILSCRHEIWTIHPKSLDLHARTLAQRHNEVKRAFDVESFCGMSWSVDAMTTNYQWQPAKKRWKRTYPLLTNGGALWWLSLSACTMRSPFGQTCGYFETTIKPQYNFQQKKGPKVTFPSLTDIHCYWNSTPSTN